MRQRPFFVFCLIVLAGCVCYAQTKSLTNADLEGYKESRLKAEREYRENYKRLGLPSPEELDRRREESRVETERLSAKLRAERLERERLEMEQERAIAQIQASYLRYISVQPETQYGGVWYVSNSHHHHHGSDVQIPIYPSGYFAGGHFWPPPVGTRPVLVQMHGRH